ncbi:MAG: DegT/DnrJ/EryC1/StrS family aminotransferase [Desulfobacteraceae bacterium]|nr:MAG: DegT/DnrJ/EryC1/StrS family aminotransferase [Desulfobacteraceae bacterium]
MPGFEIFGDEERQQVQEVLETGVLMRYGFDGARKGRWKAREFETELSAKLGVKYCHLCSSGTAALSVALAACGIGAGDQVIVPPFTFVATIESLLMAGAVPVFVDIDESLGLDPAAVEAAVTPATKAVLPVHMCGAMVQIDRLKALCERKGVLLIEDACQSVGATFKGKAMGSFGKMGCFSFDPVKTVTCGEGGAVITDDPKLYDLAQAFSDHGHDHVGTDRGLEKHAILGTNFRISELNAAVGLAQLRKLDQMLTIQRRNKAMIKEALTRIPGVTFRSLPDPQGDSATFLSFFLPEEEKTRQAAKALAQAGVDSCFYWYDNNWHYLRQWDHIKTLSLPAKLGIGLTVKAPDYTKVKLPQSDRIMGRLISMQIKLSWSEAQIAQRVEKMVAVLQKSGA